MYEEELIIFLLVVLAFLSSSTIHTYNSTLEEQARNWQPQRSSRNRPDQTRCTIPSLVNVALLAHLIHLLIL
ncbi:hypothetical protein ACB092_10G211300 [Castanea dentata]